MKTILKISAVLSLGALAMGCAASDQGDEATDAEGAALSQAREASETAFEAQMADLERRYASGDDKPASAPTPSLAPQTAKLGVSRTLCEHLRPFARLEHAYFYYGGYFNADVVVGAQVGMDFVFDLWNRQAAAFSWKSATANIGTAGSIGVGGYVGYGFGDKANVIDAWAGRFDSVSASLEIPGTKLGIEGSGFRSPDGTIVGGAIGAAAGLSASWPLPVSGTLETGFWVPFDSATKRMAAVSLGARRSLGTATALTGDPRIAKNAKPRAYDFVQYQRSSDLALGLLWSAPAGVSLAPAAQAVAIGVLREAGRSIEQLCPGH